MKAKQKEKSKKQAVRFRMKKESGIHIKEYITKSKGTQTYIIATPTYEVRFGTPFVKQAMSTEEQVKRNLFIIEKTDELTMDEPMSWYGL